jgi:hypothetical protein
MVQRRLKTKNQRSSASSAPLEGNSTQEEVSAVESSGMDESNESNNNDKRAGKLRTAVPAEDVSSDDDNDDSEEKGNKEGPVKCREWHVNAKATTEDGNTSLMAGEKKSDAKKKRRHQTAEGDNENLPSSSDERESPRKVRGRPKGWRPEFGSYSDYLDKAQQQSQSQTLSSSSSSSSQSTIDSAKKTKTKTAKSAANDDDDDDEELMVDQNDDGNVSVQETKPKGQRQIELPPRRSSRSHNPSPVYTYKVPPITAQKEEKVARTNHARAAASFTYV